MYSGTRTDLTTFLTIDRLLGPTVSTDELVAALAADNWQVQQMALWALAERGDIDTATPILGTLDAQDAMDVYGSPDQWAFDGVDDIDTRETWRCRFRVKQAACQALGRIGERHGPAALGARVIDRLARYARSQDEDYVVRAAACQALRGCRATAAREALETAATDTEWCTATEARKALQVIANG